VVKVKKTASTTVIKLAAAAIAILLKVSIMKVESKTFSIV
jgi:hypothetical protein